MTAARSAPDGAGTVAVVGEALVDLVRAGPEPFFEAFVGGSPANVAVGLVRLGVPVRLAARISDDPLGRRIRGPLDENDVDLSYAVAAVHSGSLALTMGPGADLVLSALTRARATATISYDPNCRTLLMEAARDDLRARVERVPAVALGALLDEAVLASAFTCTRRGPEPPTAAGLTAFLDPVRN